MSSQTLFIGSDHAGVDLKQALISEMKNLLPGLRVVDCGTNSSDSVDYPKIAEKVCKAMAQESGSKGILICGTGIGMSIAANKFPGIRAACVWSTETAKLSREHNDSNVLCLGGRVTSLGEAADWTRIWLSTAFLGGRHLNRVEQIKQLEGQK